jgi:two-component system, LytTR family, sensor kinase
MKKKAFCFIFILFICNYSSIAYTSYFFYTLSSFSATQKTNPETYDLDKIINKAYSFLTDSTKVDSLKSSIESAEKICKMNHIDYPSRLLLLKSEFLISQNDYQGATQMAEEALEKAKASGELENQVKILYFLGKHNIKTGFYQEALNYFNESNKIAKENHIKGIIPKNLMGISRANDLLENYAEYRKTLLLEIEAAKDENDTVNIEDGLFRLGSFFTNKEENRDFHKADSLLKSCLLISLIQKDTSFTGLALANLGWNFYLENRYDSAIFYYNQSLSYSIPGKAYSTSANSFGNLGTIYRDLDNTKKSVDYYLKSIKLAKIANDEYSLSWVYNDMSQMYLREGDTANAYLSYVNYKKYSDKYLKNSNTQGLADARIRFEAESHRKEVELLSLKLHNQRMTIYGYTALFILCLFIGILVYNRSRINSKRRIIEMNHKISELTQANLRQQMNPHFIFNTLNSIQYYMYQHDKLATNNYLTKFSSLIRKVLENSQHTSIPIRDEIDALNLYLELEITRFKGKFDYKINIDEEIDPILYKIPTMLIQPYVENSICHGLIPADNKGLIIINLKLESNYISCIIEDNGIGRKAAMEKKSINRNNHNSLGTQIANSRLDLVNTLYGTSLKTIYTDLHDEDGNPTGTKVEIHIPILT